MSRQHVIKATTRRLKPGHGYDYFRWMLEQAATFEDEAKAWRWIGFVQGALWSRGAATIDELREDVKASKKAPEGAS